MIHSLDHLYMARRYFLWKKIDSSPTYLPILQQQCIRGLALFTRRKVSFKSKIPANFSRIESSWFRSIYTVKKLEAQLTSRHFSGPTRISVAYWLCFRRISLIPKMLANFSIFERLWLSSIYSVKRPIILAFFFFNSCTFVARLCLYGEKLASSQTFLSTFQ